MNSIASPITADQEPEIINQYRSGMWIGEIADYHGTTRYFVKQILYKNGIPMRNKRKKTCEKCGTSNGHIETHYKDHNPKNRSSENLMLVCHRCHMIIRSANRGEI